MMLPLSDHDRDYRLTCVSVVSLVVSLVARTIG